MLRTFFPPIRLSAPWIRDLVLALTYTVMFSDKHEIVILKMPFELLVLLNE